MTLSRVMKKCTLKYIIKKEFKFLLRKFQIAIDKYRN